MSVLTNQQVEYFHEYGYLFLGKILTDEQIAALIAEEQRFRSRRIKPGQSTNKTIFMPNLCDFSEPIRNVSTQGLHIPMVQQLIGPDLCLTYNQLVTKMPDDTSCQSEFPWHQDNGYGTLEPMTDVTVWIALMDVDEQNGCVWVMPKSHKRGLIPHEPSGLDTTYREARVEGDGVPACLKAGEAIAFSGLTLHRSKFNYSDQPRLGFFTRYCEPGVVRLARNNQPVLEDRHSWMVAGAAPFSEDAS